MRLSPASARADSVFRTREVTRGEAGRAQLSGEQRKCARSRRGDRSPYFGRAVALRRRVGAQVFRHARGLQERLSEPGLRDARAHPLQGSPGDPGPDAGELKPRVAGIEPLDILNYKQASPDFPQQSTTDQFYDKAQWEGYRSLGYWIAEQIFSERTPASADKWVPRKMFA